MCRGWAGAAVGWGSDEEDNGSDQILAEHVLACRQRAKRVF